MSTEFNVKSELLINAPVSRVWDALVNPSIVKQYMFGTDLEADWKEGGTMTWRGEWEGKTYEDHGTVLEVIPEKRLRYSFSPMSGDKNKQENFHIVTIDLAEEAGQTRLTLTQDNNQTQQSKEQSEKNWTMMLGTLKSLLEK